MTLFRRKTVYSCAIWVIFFRSIFWIYPEGLRVNPRCSKDNTSAISCISQDLAAFFVTYAHFSPAARVEVLPKKMLTTSLKKEIALPLTKEVYVYTIPSTGIALA